MGTAKRRGEDVEWLAWTPGWLRAVPGESIRGWRVDEYDSISDLVITVALSAGTGREVGAPRLRHRFCAWTNDDEWGRVRGLEAYGTPKLTRGSHRIPLGDDLDLALRWVDRRTVRLGVPALERTTWQFERIAHSNWLQLVRSDGSYVLLFPEGRGLLLSTRLTSAERTLVLGVLGSGLWPFLRRFWPLRRAWGFGSDQVGRAV